MCLESYISMCLWGYVSVFSTILIGTLLVEGGTQVPTCENALNDLFGTLCEAQLLRSKPSQGMPYGDLSPVDNFCTHKHDKHCTERVMSLYGLHSYTFKNGVWGGEGCVGGCVCRGV